MTRNEARRLLQASGTRPSQSAGQNFLLDESVCHRMIEAADLKSDDTVLEIGPGLGVLTKHLAAACGRVIAVELDQRLYAFLKAKTAPRLPKLELIHGDIFRIRLTDYLSDFSYQLVSNLPYSATSLVFRQFLTQTPRPSRMTVLIQKEVAERLTASAGQMSLLSVSAQYYSKPSILFHVPKELFYPEPKVTSSVVRLDLITNAKTKIGERMLRLAKHAFANRRKQLKNSLAAGLRLDPDLVVKNLVEAGVPPEARPQELHVRDWLRLANLLGIQGAI